jgi:hypothetical protein
MLSNPPFGKDYKDIREDSETENGRRGALPLVKFVHLGADKQVI